MVNNLHTPPPSYEAATGISGAPYNQTNPFFLVVPHTTALHSSIDDTTWPPPYFCNDSQTSPIIPAPSRPSTPTPTISSAQQSMSVPLNTEFSIRQQSHAKVVCHILIYFCVIGVVVWIALALKGDKTELNYNLAPYTTNTYEYGDSEYKADGWERSNHEWFNS